MNAGIICDYLKYHGYYCDVRYFKDGTIELIWAPDIPEETKLVAQSLVDAGIPEPPDIQEFKDKLFVLLPSLGKLQLAPVMALDNSYFESYLLAFMEHPPDWTDAELLFKINELAKECHIIL